MPAETEVIVRTGGGGGWGDPLERDPEKVRADVIEELVSATLRARRLRRGARRRTFKLDRGCDAQRCATEDARGPTRRCMTALEQLGAYVAQGVRGARDAALRATLALHVIDTVGGLDRDRGDAGSARTCRVSRRRCATTTPGDLRSRS